jgi:uncharacterized protein (DUF2336 family)
MTNDGLLDQLENVMGTASIARRAEVLRRVTDLFMAGTGSFSQAQVELFDEVMIKLAEGLEVAARAAFGGRLAATIDAPLKVTRLLAFDEAIEVAAPVLSHSARLNDELLVENASTMSQDHLLAISKRKWINENVTDILIERGNSAVTSSTVNNGGSRFSTTGFSRLVEKSLQDSRLAFCLWSRPDVPRQDLMNLFQRVSEETRTALEAARPREAQQIRSAIAAASDRIQTIVRTGSPQHQQAREEMKQLCAEGALDEQKILRLAAAKDFDRTAVGLALLCSVPINLVERSLVQKRWEQLLVFAKAAGFSWPTAKALLLLKGSQGDLTTSDLDQCFATYSRMQQKTAATALQFYRMRERAECSVGAARLQ